MFAVVCIDLYAKISQAAFCLKTANNKTTKYKAFSLFIV